jgi:hypothetical protein
VFGVAMNAIWHPGQGVAGLGLSLLGFAALGGGLALGRQSRWAVIPGLAAAAFLVRNYLDAMASAFSVEPVGWAAMGLGCLVMLIGGALGWKNAAPPA